MKCFIDRLSHYTALGFVALSAVISQKKLKIHDDGDGNCVLTATKALLLISRCVLSRSYKVLVGDLLRSRGATTEFILISRLSHCIRTMVEHRGERSRIGSNAVAAWLDHHGSSSLLAIIIRTPGNT